jgi:hypothetical protein
VIVILTTLVAAAIPILAPADDDRRLREASRGLNTFITGAQARAIALNRPYGVALKRLSSDTDNDNNPNNHHDDSAVCLEVFYVEQPPPYAGFDANSRVNIAIHPDSAFRQYVLVRFITRGTTPITSDRLPQGWDRDLFPTGVIRPGDVIEVNGTRYKLLPNTNSPGGLNIDVDPTIGFFRPRNAQPAVILAVPLEDPTDIVTPPPSSLPPNSAMLRRGQQIDAKYDRDGYPLGSDRAQIPTAPAQPPWPYWSAALPYKILRQPMPASDEPYQLPEGTAIDLRASGVGSNNYFYVEGLNDNNQGILIMFAPEGRVSRVSYSQAPPLTEAPYDQPTVENIFLLLGKRENAPPPAVGADASLDPTKWSAASTDEARAEIREPINWLQGAARWIVIGSQSGRIATIENSTFDPAPYAVLAVSGELKRNEQIQAAREFTREMSQVGGR